MTTDQTALLQYALGEADDALILGQRLCEWCYHAPYLEEDLALANVSLDFLGRAQNFYQYAAQLDPQQRTADQLAMLRDSREFRNLLIVELPIGDFAFTMARQFLLDCFYVEFMTALQGSADPNMAGIAAKAIKESQYHLRRSHEWLLRLGDGTEESHRRMQIALDQIWGYTMEMFENSPAENELLAEGIAVDRSALKPAWDTRVNTALVEATLSRPEDGWSVRGGRDGIHTEHHGHLLSELQFLQRAYPGLEW